MKPLVDLDTQLATMDADERLGLHDLPRLTSQQKVYVAARVSGLNITASSREAGCSAATGGKWEKDPDIVRYREHYEEEMERHSLPRVRFGVEQAHMMYMKAYHSAGTAMEMVRATDSLAFFGALWRAQDPDNAHTRALKRRNIAVLKYTLHGHERIGMFDMVSLATYAQRGERAPTTAAEAATNLLENLARAIDGPQTTAVEHPVLLDPTSMPSESVVVWVDPVSGEGVTLGEAMGRRAERIKANATASELEKERATLSNRASVQAELLYELRNGLATAMGESSGDRKQAYQHWIEVLDGKRKKDIKMSASVEREFNDIGRTTRATQRAVERAAAGMREFAPKGLTLKDITSEHLSTLTRLGKVSDQLKASGAPYVYEADAAEREYQSTGTEDRDVPDYVNDRALSDTDAARAVKEIERSGKTGMRTGDELRDDAPAPMADLNSRAPALKFPDAKELIERNSAMLSVKIASAARAEPGFQERLENKPAAPKPVDYGKPRFVTPFKDLLASGELPQGDDKTGALQPAAWRPRVIGNLSMMENGFIQELVKQGVPLRNVTVAVEPSLEALLDGVGESSARYGIKRGHEQGGSFYIRTEKGPLVVLRGSTGDARLVELAHELGHAVKDEVWHDLKTEQREALEAAFKRDYASGLAAFVRQRRGPVGRCTDQDRRCTHRGSGPGALEDWRGAAGRPPPVQDGHQPDQGREPDAGGHAFSAGRCRGGRVGPLVPAPGAGAARADGGADEPGAGGDPGGRQGQGGEEDGGAHGVQRCHERQTAVRAGPAGAGAARRAGPYGGSRWPAFRASAGGPRDRGVQPRGGGQAPRRVRAAADREVGRGHRCAGHRRAHPGRWRRGGGRDCPRPAGRHARLDPGDPGEDPVCRVAGSRLAAGGARRRAVPLDRRGVQAHGLGGSVRRLRRGHGPQRSGPSAVRP